MCSRRGRFKCWGNCPACLRQSWNSYYRISSKRLISTAVVLAVADNPPPLEEECIPIRMDEELAAAYQQKVEEPLAKAIKEMMKRRDRRLLGMLLQTLLVYPDYAYGWGSIGYWETAEGGGRGEQC